MGCQPSKHVLVEEARQRNAGNPFYLLPPDIICTLYNMLDTSCDRASFYHTCKATRIPQIQCQLRKACLFADISNSSSALVTSASIERAVESITHHPGSSVEILSVHCPNWELLQQLKKNRDLENKVMQRLREADTQQPAQLLSTVQRVHLVAHTCRGPLPCTLLSTMCPHLTTLSGLDLRIRSVSDLDWLHALSAQRPTLKTLCARSFVVLTKSAINLPPALEWQVASITFAHTTAARHLAAPAFAHGVHGIMVCPALMQARERDVGNSLNTLIQTFPNIRSLKLLEAVNQSQLPLHLLQRALGGWPMLRKLGLLVPNVSYLIKGALPDWLRCAVELAQQSALPSLEICLAVRASGLAPSKHHELSEHIMSTVRDLLVSCEAAALTASPAALPRKVSLEMPALEPDGGEKHGRKGGKKGSHSKNKYLMNFSLF